jgi:membrane protein YqaA with SNARE-associated domain
VAGFFMSYVPGFSAENIDYVGTLYRDNAMLAIIGAAFTPIPFKVFTVTAGVFHDYVSIGVLLVASIIGRAGRFYLVAACIFFFGAQTKVILEKYLELATLILFVLGVGGFVALKFLL